VNDPVTRHEGPLKIEVIVDTVNGRQQVVDAKATGALFRGFEAFLKSRDPLDAPDLAQRACSVCSVSHGLAASLALEAAARVVPPENARIMRNLVLGSNFIQSHILHFYHLAAQDFVDGPNMPPWQPGWIVDQRFTTAESQALVNNYVKALEMRRKAHEMGALLGGRLPHPPALVPGGITTTPRAARIAKFKSYLAELIAFINDVYLPDVAKIARRYADYFFIGGGPANLLAFGVFDLDSSGQNKLLRRGFISDNGAWKPVDITEIAEQVTYFWLKAPRYSSAPYEVGPLARMCVNGDYPLRASVMNRHEARAQEAHKVAHAMQTWVSQLNSSGPVYQRYNTPANASGVGLTEAPHGALGHWVQITGARIGNYQILTPTCWNAPPKDSAGVRGPLEHALLGTPVADVLQPIEVVRVIHSFDPHLSCAVHAMRPAEGARIYALGQSNGNKGSRANKYAPAHA
jgi:hydrogenase large subunit